MSVPSSKKVPAVRSVITTVAATTVRKARLTLPVASNAALAATIARTAAAASWTVPTTPRTPALQARIASVSAAAIR